MRTIAVLGAGRVGAALATKLAHAGHTIHVGVRAHERASVRWQGPPVTFSEPAAAARAGTVVINATPGETSLERLGDLGAELNGKILIDVSNATAHDAGLCYPNSSLAERLQHALPGTRVVKTLNTMIFTVMTNPGGLRAAPTAFVSGDDPEAKAVVRSLLGDLGWPQQWIADLGDITTARGPEAFVLLLPHLVRLRGVKPFALSIAA
jgi:8-hydroxy-5-deazaflavin:NADPH oxidoreductase